MKAWLDGMDEGKKSKSERVGEGQTGGVKRK